jgi:hypothetical protein
MLCSVIPSVDAKWEVKEVPTGTNQVLTKIHASGICYTDVHATKGMLGVKFPFTIGQGRIVNTKGDTKDSNYIIRLEHCMLTLFSALYFKPSENP